MQVEVLAIQLALRNNVFRVLGSGRPHECGGDLHDIKTPGGVRYFVTELVSTNNTQALHAVVAQFHGLDGVQGVGVDA